MDLVCNCCCLCHPPLTLLPPGAGKLAKQELVNGLLASMIRQAIEKLNGLRKPAGNSLFRLWKWQLTQHSNSEVEVLRKLDILNFAFLLPPLPHLGMHAQ